jgi:hypothetical protein
MDYAALYDQATYTTTNGVKVFAGTVDDPFWIDLGAAFDTANFRTLGSGVPDLRASSGAESSKRGLAGAWSAILAVGIRPCSGAIIILVFALAQGLFAAGVAATLVMAVGTGLTVAVLATLAVSARGLAVRLAGAQSQLASVLIRTIEIAAAAAVLLLGLLLLGGALSGGLPG